MLAHRRLAELQLLARRLRHVQGERAAVLRARGATLATAAATAAAAAANKQHADVVVLRRQPHTVRAAHADEQLQRLDAVRERLLFRRLPVALSLVERSVAAHMPANTTSRTAAAAAAVAAPQHEQLPAPDDSGATVVVHDTCSEATRSAAQLAHVRSDALLQQQQRQQQRVQLRIARVLLLALHDAEYARRRLYDEKLRQLQRRCALAQRAVRRPRRGSGDDDNDDAAAMHDAKAALRAAREDVQLLQQSLLARPYLSARMWRMLLCDGVWAAAVARQQQQQQREGNVTASSSSPALLLLHMCLTFARLTLGVLREYVHGGTVNATSPRFAASLPSAAWRTRTATRIGDSDVTNDDEHTKNKNNNKKNNDDNVVNDDKSNNDAAGQSAAEALFSVMQHDDATAPGTATTPPTRGGQRRTRRARPQLSRLRWLPPRSATVVPLMLDTLAMHSFVVPELCVEALVRAGYVADVLALFVTLQKAAMTLLALHNDGDSTSADAATRTRLHTVLQRLERALLQHGARTRDALAQELLQQTQPQPSTRTAVQLLLGGSHHSSSSNGSGSVHAHTVTAAATAARVLIDLDHLQLLQLPHAHTRTRTRAHTRTRDTAAALVDALQLVLFPQLRTSTYATLAARARHTALLAYTTRRHRAHLYKQHGGPAGATRYLLQTVVQHARLQRRQMAAALHDRYLHDAQHDAAVALARALSLDDAVRLLHLFITHACDTPSDGGAVAASRGTAARQQQQQLHTTDRRVTVMLLMADVMLLVASMSHTPPRRADDNVHQQQQQHELLPLALLAKLWVSLTRLWPVIDSRRELQRHGRHSQHSSAAAHVAVVHNETALLTAMCEYVLHAINGQLAMRLQWLQRQHDKEATSDSSSSHSSDDVDDVAVTAADVVVLATGLREWGGGDGDSVAALQLLTTPQRARRPAALLTLAQTTGKLLRELMLHDVALWSAVRTHSLAERQRFEQHLRSSLHSMGALDTATDTALQRICYAV